DRRAAGAGPRATACRRATTRWARRPAAQRQSMRQPQPGAAVRGEGADDGLRLPGAGDGERAVQVAWRKKHRSADAGGPRQRGERAHHAREVHTSGAWHATLGARPVLRGDGATESADASVNPPSALVAAGVGGADLGV